jgi:signal transduction histidine kinase
MVFSFIAGRRRPCRPLLGMVFALLGVPAVRSQVSDEAAYAPMVLTNIHQIWEVPYDKHRSEPHRIQTDALIYYYDAEWKCAWGECRGTPTWLPIFDSGIPLKAGQRISIDGVALPAQERFDWSKTQIRILEEGVECKAETIHSLSENPKSLDNHLVSVEGLISRMAENPRRVTLNIRAWGTAATAYVLKDTNGPTLRFKEGDLVRMKCVYAPRYDQNGNVREFNLWAARPADIDVISTAKQGQFPVASTVLTNIYQIWETPQEQRADNYRMRTEVVIYYFDAEWNVAWGECLGRPTYLPIPGSPTLLKAGQRVAIDGIVVPVYERFLWNQTQLRVLEEVKLKPSEIRSLSENPVELKSHLVSVKGLIDRQMEDRTHVTLNFMVEGAAATAFVLKSTNGPAPHFKAGDFVRMTCVYAPQFDREGKLSDLTLWVARPGDIEVIGSLSEDPRFATPITPCERIRDDTPTNDLLHVEGTVHSHEPGKWVTIWDATGQIMVQSKQTQPLRFGDQVEAIGYPYVLGLQQCLHGGLYRLSTSTNSLGPAAAGMSGQFSLRLAEQIRELSREDAARHLPVSLRALVTWAHPEMPFAYVQDASGGIRLANPKWETEEASKPGTIVIARGEVSEGDFVPVVTNAVVSRAGWWNFEAGPSVTIEQALTGVEDGRWVEMRGFVRGVTNVNGLVRLDMSTSGGEFEAWVPASQSFDALKGSIVRVQGVCAAIANERHQLTGIRIWSPEAKYIQVEAAEPDDLFAIPMRALGDLRRFNMGSALDQRIRTAGTVVLHAPSRYLYVQDGADSVFALSRQHDLLRPGDRVEVVGFPGNQGRRFLLREAAYRRVSTTEEPTPAQLSTVHSVNVDWEGLLAKAEGTLLNTVKKEGEARLLIHSRDSVFEASLDATATDATLKTPELQLGSRLAVTGVYEVQSDEYGKPRSFLLRLRSWNDVHLLQRPPWWTLARLLWVLLAVFAVFLLALAWGVFISRKNTLLRRAQADLQLAHDKLEQRVQERTRELQEQMAAKERARAELAAAQESLMLASRRAGMAEVATGVLHNVGNVLNSVNISITLLSERLQHTRVEYVAKVAALLQKPADQLARFLGEDPKGKPLPGYLEKLAQLLIRDKQDMQAEIKSLVKNVEHIKVIVAMQQSYAKMGGVLEELDVKDLVEDAIQVTAPAFDRHRIELIRDYQPVPTVMVDRHKILQILINLLNNAKQALVERTSGKKVTLSIRTAEPDSVRISVSDNGVGIAPENLNSVFSQGFTTKQDGHGFGLHSGANVAKELGGSLFVHSNGLGHGATFTLELPAMNSDTLESAFATTEAVAS